jgi:two-component system, chemotaxis family, protein-glutamate methylesterase/glutaminase
MVSPALLEPRSCEAVVIGASAGAVEALSLVLPHVPKAARVPIVVVVHLPPNRPSLLPEVFASRCQPRVAEPEDKEPVTAGTIWFAPSNYHLLIERDRTFSLSVDDPVRFSRPSIDVLFESAADAFGSRLCGIVLTGANDDGARGAEAIRNAGGIVVVQDPDTADSRDMPSAAIARANPQFVASLPEIAAFLRQATETSP